MNRYRYQSNYIKPSFVFCGKCGHYGLEKHHCQPVRIDEQGRRWEFFGRMPIRQDIEVIPLPPGEQEAFREDVRRAWLPTRQDIEVIPADDPGRLWL